MQLGGKISALRRLVFRMGPRRRAALAVGSVWLAGYSLVTLFLGVEWGVILLAGVASLTLVTAAGLYLDLRRHHKASMVSVSAGAAAQQRWLADAEQREARRRQQLREMSGVLRSLSETVEGRLETMERAHRRAQAEVVWFRAEQQRWRHPGGPPAPRRRELELRLIRASGLFDHAWYRLRCGAAAADLVEHYVDHGAAHGIDPHPLFAGSWYLARHPNALVSWRTPLAHFLAESADKHVDPHPAFWSQWYAERHLPEGYDGLPVRHFLTAGVDAGCDPNPVFDVRWYRQRYSDQLPPGVNPLVHYLTDGAASGLDPSARFSTVDARRRLGALTDDPLSAFLAAQQDPVVGLRPPVITQDAAGRAHEADLRWEYLVRGLHQEPDTFVLYRIVGNDLPPRHRIGQSLDNLRFVLSHEPRLPGCEKRWVVNRIVDPELEKRVIALLEEHGMEYLHIPFEPDEYRKVGWRFAEFPVPGFTYRSEFDQLSPNDRQRALDHVYHDKNRYVMNNNGARNAALRQGRALAKWVLPWDGNCFLTRPAWDELVAAIRQRPHLKYFTVPMARILDNEVLLRPHLEVEACEEPQLVFRRDAGQEFHPDARYGRRPKVELFHRLGIPGPWDTWPQLPWDLPRPDRSAEAGQFGVAGWVARLFSGERELEEDIVGRGFRRMEAVRERIDQLDEGIAAGTLDVSQLFTMDDDALRGQRERARAGEAGPGGVLAELVRRAETFLDRPTYAVTAKTTLPPSGDPHDYWHPAPYWWPNPRTRNGLPYVWRDGQRVPGTLLGGPGSEQYDRTSLQSMIDETTLSALAGFFTGDARFLRRGADLVRTWFLDPATRMNPHLRYAQVRRGHDGHEGTASGIIETNDFHYLLDAVRLLERQEALRPAEVRDLRAWFGEFRAWLRDSDQGRAERATGNNHGTWYDVQVAAIDTYLGDIRGLLHTLRRAHERVGQQFEPDGRQPAELARTQSQHYCAYNLQGWVSLAGFADRAGQDLWAYQTPDGRGLDGAVRWVLRQVGEPWPYEQSAEFDPDRLVVLAHEVSGKVAGLDPAEVAPPSRRVPWRVRQVFSPHDGIRPFWLLGQG